MMPGMPFWVAIQPRATFASVLTLMVLAWGLAPAHAETPLTKEVMKQFPNVRGEVRLQNIAGTVTVEASADEETSVRAVIHAAGDTETEARKLLDALEFDFKEKDGGLQIEARYPLDRHTVYHYPDYGGRGNSTSTSYQNDRKVTVVSRKTSESVTLWVDLELRLERGTGVHVKEIAGEITVSGVAGAVIIENGWGDLTIADVEGELTAETGAGDVDVRRHRGKVVVDTGSGQVVVEDVKGDVDADTGSGDVVVNKVAGGVQIETGSGDVETRGVTGVINIDTGSGDTRIIDALAEEVAVDTGSGTISVVSPLLFHGPNAAVARFGTGSGDVILHIDDDVSMLLSFSSGSGRVRSPRALEGRVERVGKRGDGRYRIGGDASRVTVGTGSGDVVLRLAGE